MNLDYIERHQTTEFKPFVVAVTGIFLRKLTRSLSSAELELAVLKQLDTRGSNRMVSFLKNYTDTNQLLLDAILEATTDESEETIEITSPLVDRVCDEAWAAANRLLQEVLSE